MKIKRLSLCIFICPLLSSCSLFFGNIKPIDEKSRTYGVLDLSKQSPEWLKLESTSKPGASSSKELNETQTSDLAFQSQKTASVISLNSACKSFQPDENRDLKELTRELLLGISHMTLQSEKALMVDSTPALETTVRGSLNKENVMLRTVVLQRGTCIYDLMYVSRPEKFKKNENDFSNFVASLKLQ